MVFSHLQRDSKGELKEKIGNEKIIVDFAMRYGNPSIKSKIHDLQNKGCENLIILPLYPQYAAATTATPVSLAREHSALTRARPPAGPAAASSAPHPPGSRP